MTIEEEVERFVSELTNQQELDHSTNLFETGALTSLDVLDLLSFLEDTFAVSIPDDDIGIENLGSIDSITGLIEKLKQTA